MSSYQYVATQANLYRFLEEIETASWIAYDTEFISEGRYQAELCLLQVATEMGNYLIDPLKIHNLCPFWERLCQEDTVSIAHSCRSELEFCHRAIGRCPSRVFDVQLAAAFIGLDYPMNFKTLAQETIGVELDKSETRTDWTRRPLLKGQLDYALNDVCYLKEIADELTRRLEEKERTSWFLEESRVFCETLVASFDDDHWRKILGSKHYSSDELAIIRELWRWRRDKASAKNIAPSRIIRDDLILELAKRKTSDPERIAVARGIKGLPGSELIRDLSATIARALALDDSQKPTATLKNTYPQYSLATQFLNIIIGQYCKSRDISAKLTATVADIREYIAFYAGTLPKGHEVKLAKGWRHKFLEKLLRDFLDSRFAIKFSHDLEEAPLVSFELDK